MGAGQANSQRGEETPVTIVGGGIAGLVAAISCAEAGRAARVLEVHEELGGRARATSGPYVANFGPHALYKGRGNWRWLEERKLLPPMAKASSREVRFLHGGKLRRMPPPALLHPLVRRVREAPLRRDYRSWASERYGEKAAEMLCNWAGAFTFDPDPGRLSAAFVWERMRWIYLPPAVHYVIGGWTELVTRLQARARELGVAFETAARVESLPAPPVIVATELEDARRLLGDESLRCESPRAALLDLGLHSRRGDPGGVIDLDGGVLVERVTAFDPSLAPEGEELMQAHVGIAAEAPVELGVERIETALDASYSGWRERVTWRRQQLANRRTGALDLPGSSWSERPAIERGGGVFLAGDQVAAPGVLSEVAFESAQVAAQLACAWPPGGKEGNPATSPIGSRADAR